MKKYIIFGVVFFLFSPLFADAQVYTQTATPGAQTSKNVLITIDCSYLNSTISEVWLYYSDRGLVSTSTLSFGSVVYATTTDSATNVAGWKHIPLSSDFNCLSGTTTMNYKSNVSGSYSMRGTSTYDSFQIAPTCIKNTGACLATSTIARLALQVFAGTPPTPPAPVRPVTPPPEIFSGLVTRYSTTSCSGSATASTCVMEYVPEVYYLDWLLVNLFIIFLLSFTVIGFFMQRSLKS